jgi:MOSC domain-containing protein YiiM
MRVASVNVGTPAPLRGNGRVVRSAIVKRPVEGAVRIGAGGLEGDRQADLRVHGGPDKAVYAYPLAHYAAWAAALGRDDLAPGHFGENLTVEGIEEDEVRIGDAFRAGSALLEVSQPRVPCHKLAMRMGDPAFQKPFQASGRVGFYLRVLEEGRVRAGDPFRLERRGDAAVSVREVSGLLADGAAAGDLERAAAVEALAPWWRTHLAARAAALRRGRRSPQSP